MFLVRELRQPGDLGIHRGVTGGVAEEARIRGFASPAFAGFAFICSRFADKRKCCQFRIVLTNVRKGSLAELNDTPNAAVRAAGIGGIADHAIRGEFQVLESTNLNPILGIA